MTSCLDSELGLFESSLLLERGLSRNTCTAYISDLRDFGAFLAARGVASVAAITRDDIVAFLSALRVAGRAERTRARRTAAIRSFLRHLAARGAIKANPADLLDSPRKGLTLPRVLSEAEVAAMLDAVAGDDPRDLRDRALLETLYGCGLRVSEAAALSIGDFEADGELIRIRGKGSKDRLVPVGGAAGRALARYLEGARGTFARGNPAETHVFLTRLGRPFTRQGIFKIVRERATAVGIAPERISPHVLRHSYASHMLSHGADIRAIQELLGHADISTTQIYTHVDAAGFGAVHRQHHPRA